MTKTHYEQQQTTLQKTSSGGGMIFYTGGGQDLMLRRWLGRSRPIALWKCDCETLPTHWDFQDCDTVGGQYSGHLSYKNSTP